MKLNMKTPKEYQDNLKNKIITEEMFSDCLYSVNKRAKNHRDKAKEYKRKYRFSHIAAESQYDKMNEFYQLKDRFLKYLEPTCIHKQWIGYETKRVYSYDKEYYRQQNKNIVWENCYYDYERDQEVWFYDYELATKKYLYFLYYELETRSFHTPIKNPEDYDLEIIEIDSDFQTYGSEPKNLLSPQFVKKVIKTLETLNCKLMLNHQTIEFTDREKTELSKPKAEQPTEKQLAFINNICEFYRFENPNLPSKNKAKKWINDVLKEHDFQADKKKAETKERNQRLYEDFLKDIPYAELAEKYGIKEKTIKALIRTIKKEKT